MQAQGKFHTYTWPQGKHEFSEKGKDFPSTWLVFIQEKWRASLKSLLISISRISLLSSTALSQPALFAVDASRMSSELPSAPPAPSQHGTQMLLAHKSDHVSSLRKTLFCLNIKIKTTEFLFKKNKHEHLHNLGVGKCFLDWTQTVEENNG